MQRLEQETLQRCFEALEGKPLRVKSRDPRLLSQEHGVRFAP
jgi:D-3-phosphoglycerate dehydrogenase